MSSVSVFKKSAFFLALQAAGIGTHLNAEQECCTGWTVSADFLAWYASQEPSSIWADVISVGFNTSRWEALSFDFTWDYGFRVGAGYHTGYDHWDLSFYWTHFKTDAKHSISQVPFTVIIPEFFAAFLSGNSPQSVKVNWELCLNTIDGELGRCYWVSRCLSLRPFVGLKGGWIDQSIRGKYFNLTIDNVPTHHVGKERLKNNFWGVGPMGGLDTTWRVRNFCSHSLDFFGDFSLATLWGNWTNRDKYKNTASQTSSVNMKDSTLGALMFSGFVGIGWETLHLFGGPAFGLKLGYEMQLWLNQLRLATFQLQRVHGDLSFQGLTLHARLDF